MDDAERLEALLGVIGRLRETPEGRVILVEGAKDVSALRAVGVDGEFLCVQSSGGPLRAAEDLWRRGASAVILTDWDSRGGRLAEDLRRSLSALCVEYDDGIRRELSVLCRPFAKDVESIDSVVALLSSRAGVNL